MSNSLKRLNRFIWASYFSLLVFIVFLAVWHIWNDLVQIDRLVQREAHVRLQTADHIRKWIVGFGGVFAPISERHQPNPFIPESIGRDVETTDGKKLTIANSISALNAIMGKDNRIEGAFIRFTGPQPLKLSNEPDDWESMALERLKGGEELVAGYTEYEGKPYYRMMRPLILTPKCFKCHVYKSPFKIGDIVGGIDVNVDLEVYSDMQRYVYKKHIMSYSLIWLIGILAIFFAGRHWKSFLLEREALNKKLQEMAMYDSLTGFLNRHQTNLIFKNELSRAKRDGLCFSLLIIDIDNFKDINDNYGHLNGDKVLKTVSGKLRETLRESDYQIRYGGDELMFILSNSSHSEAMKKAEIIREIVSDLPIIIDDTTTIHITLSIGVATFPEHGQSKLMLIETADKALYKAKEQGRNCVVSASI